MIRVESSAHIWADGHSWGRVLVLLKENILNHSGKRTFLAESLNEQLHSMRSSRKEDFAMRTSDRVEKQASFTGSV